MPHDPGTPVDSREPGAGRHARARHRPLTVVMAALAVVVLVSAAVVVGVLGHSRGRCTRFPRVCR